MLNREFLKAWRCASQKNTECTFWITEKEATRTHIHTYKQTKEGDKQKIYFLGEKERKGKEVNM